MVPGSWLVTTLFLGAGSVSTASCATGGCPLALDRYSLEATDFARAVLAGAGLDPETVPIDPATSEVHEPAAVGQLVHPFTRAGDVEMMLALASESRGSLAVDHPASSVGVVAIEPDTCTLCAQCAQTCPTNAISATYAGTTVSLTFDAATCTNCRQCTIACPEFERGAITVVGRVDAELLRSGRQSIHTGTVLVCDICGEPIAPTSMMDRIGELLGDDFGETMSYLSRNCISCRGLS
jgi:Fe-S-cluster-containing hydrogenase component 2